MLRLESTVQRLAQHLHENLYSRWEELAHSELDCAEADFIVCPVPPNLKHGRAELIVEASDIQSLYMGVKSSADALVIDFDDTFSPTASNVQLAYDELPRVAACDIPLLVRTRALYATEQNANFQGKAAIAMLCDLSAALCARKSPPYIYIPKLESVAEADFWHKALSLAEAFLGLEDCSIRVCIQIETYSGLLNAEKLLYVLRNRAYGLNAGRWDYVFSLLKHIGRDSAKACPPRSMLTMDKSAMQAYTSILVDVCKKHSAEAIGGTASLAPNPENPEPALAAVRADKQREASQGFSAAWAGLPELVEAVKEGLASGAAPQQLARGESTYSSLMPEFISELATEDVVDAIELSLAVFSAWLEGRGVVARLGRIEDTATAELARTQLWHWLGSGLLSQEDYFKHRNKAQADASKAAILLDHLVLSKTCPKYFPLEAQLLRLV